MCIDRDCGMCRRPPRASASNRSQGDRFAGGVALFTGLVLLFGHLAGVIQGVLITLIVVGALSVSLAGGLVWWRVIRPRQLAQRAAIMAAVQGSTRLPAPRQYGGQLGAPAPYAGQLPASDPPPVQVVINLTDEQARQFLGGRNGQA